MNAFYEHHKDQNSGMMTAGKQHEVVQQCEVLMIVRDQDAACANSGHEVHRVGLAGSSGSLRSQYIMTLVA